MTTERRKLRPGQVRRFATRAARRIRELFSSTPPDRPGDSGELGGLGVREPRRPLRPTLRGAVALEAPPEEARDVWAVGEDREPD